MRHVRESLALIDMWFAATSSGDLAAVVGLCVTRLETTRSQLLPVRAVSPGSIFVRFLYVLSVAHRTRHEVRQSKSVR